MVGCVAEGPTGGCTCGDVWLSVRAPRLNFDGDESYEMVGLPKTASGKACTAPSISLTGQFVINLGDVEEGSSGPS